MKVSIVITNYNYSRYLNRSIRSAFVQHFEENRYEIIVVDDSSSDWSKEIIDSYGHFVTAIYLPKNRGLAAARNAGIRQAKGEYILFLDADDYLNRDILKIESLFLDLNPAWGAVACDYYLIDDDEIVLGRESCEKNPIACGIMFRKKHLKKVGLYDESFKMWEERDLMMRFAGKFAVYHIPVPLYRYRKHAENMTADKGKSARYLRKLKKKHRLD